MYDIFNNNPYVDAFQDSIKGEIFHDQYRIYDNNNPNIPLLEQMLEFWQFNKKESNDSQPEMYWSDEEKKLGDYIINKYCTGNFGYLLLSNRSDGVLRFFIISFLFCFNHLFCQSKNSLMNWFI